MSKIRFIAGLLILGIFGGSGVFGYPATAKSAQPPMSAMCQELNNPSHDATYGTGGTGLAEVWAGELLVFTATEAEENGATQINLCSGVACHSGGTFLAGTAFPGTLTYVVPQTTTIAYSWEVDEQQAAWQVSCQPASGCDVPLTPDAVVGLFVTDATTYWAPEKKLQPEVIIPAGKTAWVLGQDASGAYYKIIWACDTLWVSVSSMGPNVGDPVWRGAPLPTGVVE